MTLAIDMILTKQH